MKLANLKKALEKHGAEFINQESQRTQWKLNGKVIAAYYNLNGEDRVHFVNVRRENDHDDPMSDYSAGANLHTIKSVLAFAEVKEVKEAQEKKWRERSEVIQKASAAGVRRLGSYIMQAANGNPIRRATFVEFQNGKIVKFTEAMNMIQAYKAAINYVATNGGVR